MNEKIAKIGLYALIIAAGVAKAKIQDAHIEEIAQKVVNKELNIINVK